MPVILPRLLDRRYYLERRLGRSGMGTVYSATDRALERRVAVKVIREDLVGSADAAERFRREARVAASFAHPNVVTVHVYLTEVDRMLEKAITGFVDRLSGFSYLPPYYPSYRALASTLARLSSLTAPAFRWTHLHAGCRVRQWRGPGFE